MDETAPPQTEVTNKSTKYLKPILNNKKLLSVLGVCFLVFVTAYLYMHQPPKDFPIGTVVTIESGESLQSITNLLYENKIIKSPFWFARRREKS
jgi:cell division protein YceG involved in septum cleavage